MSKGSRQRFGERHHIIVGGYFIDWEMKMDHCNFSLSEDYLNSNKIMFHVGKIWNQILQGKASFPPVAVEIHPTAKCNHCCIHCSYKERNAKREELSAEAMEKLTDSIIRMGVEAVYFSGGGEPTLYPELGKYIEKLNYAGVSVALLTNGTYFMEAGLLEIANLFQYIAFSVPAVEPKNFQKITGRDLLKNVLKVPAEIKKKWKEKSPVLGSRIVLTNQNYMQIAKFLCTMQEKSFDYALFKIVRDYEENGQGLSKEEEQYLKNMLSDLTVDDRYTNLRHLFDYRAPVLFTGNCWVNQWGMLANISMDGNVYPNIVEIGNPDFAIGNIYDSPLEQIWNSSRHKQVKAHSKIKWEKGECKNCRAISYNQIINRHLDFMPGQYDPFL